MVVADVLDVRRDSLGDGSRRGRVVAQGTRRQRKAGHADRGGISLERRHGHRGLRRVLSGCRRRPLRAVDAVGVDGRDLTLSPRRPGAHGGRLRGLADDDDARDRAERSPERNRHHGHRLLRIVRPRRGRLGNVRNPQRRPLRGLPEPLRPRAHLRGRRAGRTYLLVDDFTHRQHRRLLPSGTCDDGPRLPPERQGLHRKRRLRQVRTSSRIGISR
mmetsp:Transcript_28641/g.92208  ORF Transcript_28641/g.92208 Transcript_28641/m.92208 type:complete len:216 (+) Transcript_28641:538-1185(+)